MMMARACLAAAALLALSACSEKPQETLGNFKADKDAYTGTGMAYQAAGWKAGDKAAWEQQLRVRGQGQNEYVRINN